MLTRKQNELLMFINKRLNDGGVSPSFDEMKEALRLKSKSGIHRLITGLEERGFLRRLPHRARALQVLKLPEAAALPAPNVTPLLDSRRGMGMAESREGFVPQIVRGDRVPLPGAIHTRATACFRRPVAYSAFLSIVANAYSSITCATLEGSSGPAPALRADGCCPRIP